MPYKDPAMRLAAAARWRLLNPEKAAAVSSASKKKHRTRNNARRRKWRQIPEVKAREKEKQLERRDAINAWRRKVRRENPEKYRAKDNEYNEKNREKLRAQKRARYWKNPEKYRKEARDYAAKHPEEKRIAFMRWYLRNPVAQVLRKAIRRARLEALPHTFTPEEHAFMLQYWNNSCAACGAQHGFWFTISVDHWIAVTAKNSPGTTATNLVPLCAGLTGCNNTKKNRDPLEWLLDRFGPRKAKAILKKIDAYFAIVRTRQTQAS